MKQKYTKASLEALVQKAGVISRELDAKLERMEALAAKVEEDKRESASWATLCGGHEVKANLACNNARMWCEAVRRRWRETLWLNVPLVLLLIVDVVVRLV